MSSPEPVPSPQPSPAQGEGTVGGAWRGIQGMNRWALFAIVGLILLVVWYYFWYRADEPRNEPRDNPSEDWESRARKLLGERGYPSNQVDSALNHYLRGGPMSVQDQALISVAIRALGTPDFPNPQGNNNPGSPWNTIPSTPTGPTPSGNSGAGPDPTIPVSQEAYWYVVSTGVGPSSSLRGIAQQYYGSSNLAVNLLPFNPDIKTVNERIIPGKIVKVPRSLNV